MSRQSKRTMRRLVYDILVADKTAQKDDMYLLSKVIEITSSGLTAAEKAILIQLLRKWNECQLPSFNTVIRARRYLQTKHPEIIDNETEQFRQNEEREYREEYKS